ncbi:uncharacterized protein METZ01_LOCUS208866, partial [marine metagenome]
ECSSGSEASTDDDGTDNDSDGTCNDGDLWPDCSDEGTNPYDECGECNGINACQEITGLSAIGGLNEVMLQWDYNPNAASYNIYRDGDFACSVPATQPYYLDDGTCDDGTGWGLGYDTEYCYTVVANGPSSNEACGTTLPQLQAFLDLDLSLANADIAAVASPFGDLTGDGVADAVIMVNMVNFFAVNGYQFSFSMNTDIVAAIAAIDGTTMMTGGAAGLTAQMSAPGSSGTVIGFDINGTGSIPAGYPGDGGAGGNLLAVIILNSQYSGSGDEVAVTITDFVVSGINPFTGGSVTLNACDADLDPLNGCFDVDTFSTPAADCANIPAGSAFIDSCDDCVEGLTGNAADFNDPDSDGVCNAGATNGEADNCPDTDNTDQADNDIEDGEDGGDACDADDDNDGCDDAADNAPFDHHGDFDSDGTPDDCDASPYGDVTLTYANVTENSIDILFGSDIPIYGYQFQVQGVSLTAATDGPFDVQMNPNNGMVIGFSLSGATIDAGSGTLVHLDFASDLEASSLSLSGVIVAGQSSTNIVVGGPGSAD